MVQMNLFAGRNREADVETGHGTWWGEWWDELGD